MLDAPDPSFPVIPRYRDVTVQQPKSPRIGKHGGGQWPQEPHQEAHVSDRARGGTAAFLERRTPLALVVAAALGAAGALLVNHFVPPVLERLNDPEPVLVAASYDPILYESCGWSAVVPAVAVAEGPPPITQVKEVLPWVLEQGGAPVGGTEVELRLEGRRASSVEVVDLRLRTDEVSEVETGALLNVPCEGEVPAVTMGFRLGISDIAYEITGDGEWGEPYFARNTITLAKDEILPLSVLVEAGPSAVGAFVADRSVWSLDVSVVEDGNESVLALDETFVTADAVEVALREWTLLALDGPLRWWSDDELAAGSSAP